MRLSSMTRFLEDHHIEYVVQDGKVWALEVYTVNGVLRCEWLDITNYNDHDLRKMVGY